MERVIFNNNIEKIRNFRNLIIWKSGIEIVRDIYLAIKSFSKEELYCLTSQMRRCAISIPSNIAEGFSRKHNKEYKQFLYIALSSCSELETQVEISYMLEYIQKTRRDDFINKINHTSCMINNLIKCL
jgi:four helix bundle protein